MSQKIDGSIPPWLTLDGDYVIQFTAFDASTGAIMSSVRVSNASLLVDSHHGGELTAGGTADEPLWISIPVGDTSG